MNNLKSTCCICNRQDSVFYIVLTQKVEAVMKLCIYYIIKQLLFFFK